MGGEGFAALDRSTGTGSCAPLYLASEPPLPQQSVDFLFRGESQYGSIEQNYVEEVSVQLTIHGVDSSLENEGFDTIPVTMRLHSEVRCKGVGHLRVADK